PGVAHRVRIRPPPIPPLFPYTTLFRSRLRAVCSAHRTRRRPGGDRAGGGGAGAGAVKGGGAAVGGRARGRRPLHRRHRRPRPAVDRKSTRLNSSHVKISYAVFCLKKKT